MARPIGRAICVTMQSMNTESNANPMRPIQAMDAARDKDDFSKALSGLALVGETITAAEAVAALIPDTDGREKFDTIVGASRLQRDAYVYMSEIFSTMPHVVRPMFEAIIEALELRIQNCRRFIENNS